MTLPARQHGFTLIEMMIVVGILAILSVIAIIAFGRWKRKAIRSEAATVLGAISLRQETFRSEFSAYKACPDAQQWWPALTADEPTKKPRGTNACWNELGLKTDAQLYCAYSIYAGAASDWGTIPNAHKGAFPSNPTAPSSPWYLGVAECDFDGVADGRGNNSLFYRSHSMSTMGEKNPDK